jgi:hypothetical protein
MTEPTAEAINNTYARLKDWTERATHARQALSVTQFALKEAEAQVWPGTNETERKAARMSGTQEARLNEQNATLALLRDECELTCARLALDEIHDIMRLAELAQGEPAA